MEEIKQRLLPAAIAFAFHTTRMTDILFFYSYVGLHSSSALKIIINIHNTHPTHDTIPTGRYVIVAPVSTRSAAKAAGTFPRAPAKL